MLTDRNPAVWDGDDYVREWARQRGMGRYPTCRVPVQSVDRPMIAVIRFDLPGEPVTFEPASTSPPERTTAA